MISFDTKSRWHGPASKDNIVTLSIIYARNFHLSLSSKMMGPLFWNFHFSIYFCWNKIRQYNILLEKQSVGVLSLKRPWLMCPDPSIFWGVLYCVQSSLLYLPAFLQKSTAPLSCSAKGGHHCLSSCSCVCLCVIDHNVSYLLTLFCHSRIVGTSRSIIYT